MRRSCETTVVANAERFVVLGDRTIVATTGDRDFVAYRWCQPTGDAFDTTTTDDDDDGTFETVPVAAPDAVIGLLATTTCMARVDPSTALVQGDVVVVAGPAFVAAVASSPHGRDNGGEALRIVDFAPTPYSAAEADYRPASVSFGCGLVALPWGRGIIVMRFGCPDFRSAAPDAPPPWRYLERPGAAAASTTARVFVAGARDDVETAFLVAETADGAATLWDASAGTVVKDLGVLFPGARLQAVVVSAGRLILFSSVGGVKAMPLGGVNACQVERALRMSRTRHFPASPFGPAAEAATSAGDDGFLMALFDVAAARAGGDDGSSSLLIVVTSYGVGKLNAATFDWEPLHYFNVAAGRAALSGAGLVVADFAFDEEGMAEVVQLHLDLSDGSPPRPSAGEVHAVLPNGIPLAQHPDATVTESGDEHDGPDPAHGDEPPMPTLLSFVGGTRVPDAWTAPLPLAPAATKAAGGLTATGMKPVTFGHKIRSSGYSNAVPWSVQQQRKVAEKKQRAKEAAAGHQFEPDRAYDVTCGPIAAELSKTSALLDSARTHLQAVTGIAFGAHGAVAVSSSVDGTAFAMRQPPAQYRAEGWCLKGGGVASLLCCDASNNASASNPDPCATTTFVTGSSDGTVSMWRPTKRSGPSLTKSWQGKEVKAVRFFCNDALLLAAVGGTLTVLRYGIDVHVSDLDRSRNDSRFAEVFSAASGAQSIASIDTIGYCATSKVVMGTSAKSVLLADIGAQAIVETWADAHSRPVHTVAAFSSSQFARVADASHDLLLSAAFDGTVKLWDTRCANNRGLPARAFAAHTNSSLRVGLAASPCGRFVAVGSEDRAVFIMDVRQGAALARVPVPDVPAAIKYHPLAPRLLVGCNNGALRILSPADP